MSKKNRSPWQLRKPAAEAIAHSEPAASATGVSQSPSVAADFSAISPAQLIANRANAQLSTGPRTAAGLARSSKNAVKSALTGRTVLLPTDDVDEYAAFLAGFQADLKPVGQVECELVQIVVDCYWRLRRIQELEYALYTHGHRQFEAAFADEPEPDRHSMIILQTHLTYRQDLRNLQIQETRIDRKRSKAMAELEQLQAERYANEETAAEYSSAAETPVAPRVANSQRTASAVSNGNGFEFSTAADRTSDRSFQAPKNEELTSEKAA